MTRLAVVGAGSMGAQIAQQAALHGIDTVLHDQGEDQLRKARASNQGHIARRVEKGRLSEEKAREALERVRGTTDLREAAREADFVIEAVFEDLDVKRSIFVRPGGTRLCNMIESGLVDAVFVDAQDRLTRGERRRFEALVEPPAGRPSCPGRALPCASPPPPVEAGGRPPGVSRKRPWSVRGRRSCRRAPRRRPTDNRILHAATQEAYRLLDADVASFEDIDAAVEKGLNWPMGPFRLGDFSGLDVTYNARLHMYRSTGDERYRPSPQLEAKVKAGKLGRKTGEGWYRYDP